MSTWDIHGKEYAEDQVTQVISVLEALRSNPVAMQQFKDDGWNVIPSPSGLIPLDCLPKPHDDRDFLVIAYRKKE